MGHEYERKSDAAEVARELNYHYSGQGKPSKKVKVSPKTKVVSGKRVKVWVVK